MSTIRYTTEEMLDCLAACWAYGSIGSLDGQRKLEWMADAGNRILTANMHAYNATYPDDLAGPEPTITAGMLRAACVRKTVAEMSRGRRVLDGLRYNLIANNGEDFGTAAVLDDLLCLTRNALTLANLRQAA